MDFPIGTIIAWDNATIPEGWAVCNGNNGTPNLVDRFVRGAGTDAQLRTTGGASTHYHTVPNTSTSGSHNHGGTATLDASGGGTTTGTAGTGAQHAAASHGHDTITVTNISTAGGHSHSTPNTQSVSNNPLHIKRVFIMRVA